MSLSKARSINIAILALGGQGGGVLVDWIVGMAEHEGWTAQATSVAGVAQRTGATIYYVELVSQQDKPRPDAQHMRDRAANPKVSARGKQHHVVWARRDRCREGKHDQGA